MAPEPNPFYPEMMHFALALHATSDELIDLAARWAADHELHISIERFFPDYLVGAVPLGGDLRASIAELEPVRRICLRQAPYEVVAINQIQHVSIHPQSFTIVLEPVSDDGLRATALQSKMGDENALRWWVGLVREATADWQQGAWAIEPETGRRLYVHDHWHTDGARELAAAGVSMMSSNGNARFEFDDLR